MRLSLRFLFPLALVLAGLAYAVIPLVDTLTLKWFMRDLEIRADLIGRMVEGPLSDLLTGKSKGKLLAYFDRIVQDERLFAIGFCDRENRLLYKTQTYPDAIACDGRGTIEAGRTALLQLSRGAVHVSAVRIVENGRPLGRLMLVHDMSWLQHRSADTKRYLFYLFVLIGAVSSLVTVLVAHISWRGWISGVRSMIRGEGLMALIKNQRHDPEL
ncbi:MAG TPA: trehalose-6-phosphate synthase, partial [Nitrospira sp.]|nr:trehalose-6-phosphate synthase [Nitrospira sp.]